MIQAFKHSLVLTAFAVALVAGSVQADDTPSGDIKLSEVPANVREAADKIAPKVDWTEVSKSKRANQSVYELRGKDAKGRLLGVALSSECKLIEFAAMIGEEDLPEAIKKSVDKFASKAKFDEIIRGTEGEITTFLIQGKKSDGRRIHLAIDLDGKITRSKTEIDQEEIPKPMLKSIQNLPMNKGSKIIRCWKVINKKDHPAVFYIDMIDAQGNAFAAQTAEQS